MQLRLFDISPFTANTTEPAVSLTLLEKLEQVEMTTETRISSQDNEHCIQQEKLYKGAFTLLKNTLDAFEAHYELQVNDFNLDYSKRGYIDSHDDIRHIKTRIDSNYEKFVSRMVSYFEKEYTVTLDANCIIEKYTPESIDYSKVVEEIFEQLGGLNFSEKAEQELIANSRSLVRNKSNIKITKSKITIAYLVNWSTGWNDKYRLGYSNNNIEKLFEALSHFENKETKMLEPFKVHFELLKKGEEEYDIFKKYDYSLSKVAGIRFYKNLKVEIFLMSNEDADTFNSSYLL
ncbi:hypothetical protein [Lysinibacillus fusiformis]|uniref:hypothetical protein n=1 Tax=Lysinibacillus fusiformis TaxID=28031 RepID=UPI0021BE9200|nr:hypothetical protein [Lysinibacillus fusiformis]UXJ71388.1 hypothetical protein N5069_23485 [Lysinibacillus fusiformis]